MEEVGKNLTPEKETRNRNLILYFIRHGQAEYSDEKDMSGRLTDTGRDQAREAARTLYQELPQGAVVEFISSDLNRADQTSQEMKDELERLNMDKSDAKEVVVHHGKANNEVKTFKQLAISDEHTSEFFRLSRDENGNRQDAVQIWLENPNQSVKEMEAQFCNVLRHFNRLSHQISPGPDTYIVATIHGGATDVALGRLLDETSLGQLKNCEAFKISLLANGQTTLTLRGETKDISI